MKKMIYFLMMGLSLLPMLNGCKKDTTLDGSTSASVTIVTTPPGDTEVAYLATVIYKYGMVGKKVDSCRIMRDNVVISTSASGSITLDSLKNTTFLTFIGYANGKSFEKNVTVDVGNPPIPPTTRDSLIGYWKILAYKLKQADSTVWDTVPIYSCQVDDTTDLLSTGWCQEHQGLIFCWPDEPEMWSNIPWTVLNSKQYQVGGGTPTIYNTYNIVKLTKNQLIVTIVEFGGATRMIFYCRW